MGVAASVLSFGSESDGAGAMCRATDALIRETWPVLQRTRSLQDFQSSTDSPSLCKSPASFPPDSRDRARVAAARAAVLAGTRKNGEGQAGKQEGEGAPVAGVENTGEGVSRNERWEEDAEALAVAIGGLSPGGVSPFPSSPAWKDGDGVGDDERTVSRAAR